MLARIGSRKVKTDEEYECFGCCKVFPKHTEIMCETIMEDGSAYNLYLCDNCRKFIDSHWEEVADSEDGVMYAGACAKSKLYVEFLKEET